MSEVDSFFPLPISFDSQSFQFEFKPGAFGPESEIRRLDDIRESLLDSDAEGPDELYSISMDVGLVDDRSKLIHSNLLFGVVGYAAGIVGNEPIRSQGHIHKPSVGTNISPPEIFEIWQGTAIIYLQERVEASPGRCFAITAKPGDIVVCPPKWGHMVVNADTQCPMVFGAMCDRSYTGFDYRGVKEHKGLAYYPQCSDDGGLQWLPNKSYLGAELIQKRPAEYWFSPMIKQTGLYQSILDNVEHFQWIHDARHAASQWEGFIP